MSGLLYYKGEAENPVSVADVAPIVSGQGVLFCSGRCAEVKRALSNDARRDPEAEGTCANCGTWIGDPFARAEEE